MGLFALVLLAPLARGDGPADRRSRALKAEARGAWLEACRLWDDLLRKDRENPLLRSNYNRCLRRLHQVMRQTDAVYRSTMTRLSSAQAMDLYEQVVTTLTAAHPDRERATLPLLFQHGRHELLMALDDPAFRRAHLRSARPEALSAFRARLSAWPVRPIASRAEARDQVNAVLRAAGREGVPMRAGTSAAFILEMAAGACNAMDEYSLFMTPGHVAFVQDMLKGKVGGVGIEVGVRDDRLQVMQIHPKTAAADADLIRGDMIVRIDRDAVEDWTADAVAERLRGPSGTSIEVEVVRSIGPSPEKHVFKLTRRPVSVPSVEFAREVLHDGSMTLRLKINYFAESTLQDVKDALATSSMMGEHLRGVLLDLRGNPGGLFESSVGVAELFLTEGTIVIGRSPFTKYNKTFKVESTGPVQVPVVVLIDGDTASAAEVLAGALKEGRASRVPAVLIGQTTYGKGSVQCVFPLEKGLDRPAALKLTVARLFSPSDQPYTNKGVTPHLPSDLEGEALLAEARMQLEDLVKRGDRMMTMRMD